MLTSQPYAYGTYIQIGDSIHYLPDSGDPIDAPPEYKYHWETLFKNIGGWTRADGTKADGYILSLISIHEMKAKLDEEVSNAD